MLYNLKDFQYWRPFFIFSISNCAVMKIRLVFATLVIFSLLGFTLPIQKDPTQSSLFKKYWYSGKAEISSYELSQSRYGEIHKGTASMIFVTEPFSKTKKVKVDNPRAKSYDVMKLNFTKKFNTGVYPYSLMFSSFLPLNDSKAHVDKLTMSGQEWCGHVFTQLTANGEKWKGNSFSYFESEGDQNISIKQDLLEDEIWTKIKTNPGELPTGETEMIPSLYYVRLMHKALKSYQVKANKKSLDKDLVEYQITYPSLKRDLKIVYQKNFPYQIVRWEESYPSFNGKMLTTKASVKKTIQLPYWEKHSVRDSVYRDILELDQ